MKKNRQELDSAVALTDFVTLENGSIAELIENPSNSLQTTFAVCNHGVIRYEKTVKVGGRILTPFLRDESVIKHIRLARGAQPYGSVKELYA
ncbi:MAG: hypothetical protein WA755_06595 [Candidatus Acidiferrales bacterium]